MVIKMSALTKVLLLVKAVVVGVALLLFFRSKRLKEELEEAREAIRRKEAEVVAARRRAKVAIDIAAENELAAQEVRQKVAQVNAKQPPKTSNPAASPAARLNEWLQ